MILRNLTSSIVNVGVVPILPGESAEISDPAYLHNEVIDFMVEEGMLAREEKYSDIKDLSDMKLTDLRTLAKDMGIDASGFKRKEDYIAAIEAARG